LAADSTSGDECPPARDPGIEAVCGRIRAIIARDPSQALDVIAATLHTSPDAFRRVVEDRETIDRALVVDVVAALVRELAVDPHWLLTGRFDASIHREALALGADRSEKGAAALRNFVDDQFRRWA
jgi:hypothetical protein